MDDMRELVTREQVETAFRILAVAGPLLGAVGGLLYGQLRRRSALVSGLLLGCIGTLNYGLWRLYLAVTDRYGMDRVSTLLVNLGVFVVLGACVGVMYWYLAGRSGATHHAEEPQNRGT